MGISVCLQPHKHLMSIFKNIFPIIDVKFLIMVLIHITVKYIMTVNLKLFEQGKMLMQDKLEKERNDAKNAVEEYVYDFRDRLGTVYEKFITPEVSKFHNFL